MGFSSADQKRPRRTIHDPRAAREGLRTSKPSALPAVHVPSHLLDAVGAAHGPLDARLSRRPQQHGHHEALRSSAGGEHAARHGTRVERAGWAQFWAQFERFCFSQSFESGCNSLKTWELVVGGESLELPTFWV